MKIEEGKKVKLEYSLTVEGVGVIESSEARGPLEFVQGEHALPPGLEAELNGLAVGDAKEGHFEVDIPSMEMERKDFPKDFAFEVGTRFSGRKGDQDIEFTVEAVKGNAVTVRPVHPLAGKKIAYKVKILEVSDKG